MSAHTVHLKATPSTPDSVRRPLVLILFTIFLDVLGLALIIPVAPFHARAFGADALQVGLLFTVFAPAILCLLGSHANPCRPVRIVELIGRHPRWPARRSGSLREVPGLDTVTTP